MSESRQALAELGLDLDPDDEGLDNLLPHIQRMRSEGAVVVVKWDGDRSPEQAISVIASRGGLGDGFLRTDAPDASTGLADILLAYAQKAGW